MPRTNPPIGIDAAITKVKAKANSFITESDQKGKPAAWGRTFVEPDANVYITADKEKALIDKWKSTSAIDDRFVMAGSGSSGGPQADLKLQLKAKWDKWEKGTSPFVYHIPIDKYEDPAEKKRLAEEKKKNEAAVEAKKKELELKKQQEEDAKKKKLELEKKQKEKEKQKQQAMATDWNKRDKNKVKDKDKAQWEKAWLEKNPKFK